MITKKANGRFQAWLKDGREYVTSKTFDTKREAVDWLAREKAAMAGGIDPRAGRRRVRVVLDEWLDTREHTVSTKTYVADKALRRLIPNSMQALNLAAVSEREIARSYEQMIRDGLAERTIIRYRASLSTFFGWCVREKLIGRNPVTATRVPKSSREPVEMRPWTEAELEHAYERWHDVDPQLADILLVMGWTGLRWGEVRALTVDDVLEVPTPGLIVRRSQPEGVATKATKGRRSRRVPVANRVLPIVRRMQHGKKPGDFLFTTSGGAQLHRTAVLRTVRWTQTGHGRRIHDLRHTAACLWLARSVDPGTVQAWMGHESIATTNQYLHFLGTSAHTAGLERLNAPHVGRGEGNAGSNGGATIDASGPRVSPRGQLGGNSEVVDLESHRGDELGESAEK